MVLAEFHWSWSCSGFGLHPLKKKKDVGSCPRLSIFKITSAQIQWETWHGLLLIGGKDDRGQSPSCRVCKNSSSMNWDPQNEEIPDLPTFTSFISGIYIGTFWAVSGFNWYKKGMAPRFQFLWTHYKRIPSASAAAEGRNSWTSCSKSSFTSATTRVAPAAL